MLGVTRQEDEAMQPTSAHSSPAPEYPYGWRYVTRRQADGGEVIEEVALTLEDVLHPQEGDVIPESPLHESDCRYLADVFATRPLSPPVTLVTRDLLVNWGVPGIRNHSPDVAVFVELDREPDPGAGVLELPEVGGRCELVVEVVSPNTRNNDVVAKFEHYHQVGIPLYVIIDQTREGGPRTLRAYRRKPDRYVEVESDDGDRIDVPLLGLILGMRDNRVVCFDLRTDRELGDYSRILRDLEESKRLLEEADRHAEQQQQAYEDQVLARQKAERLAREAREQADRQREEADKQRGEADKQREEADKQRRAREEIDRECLAQEKLIRELQEKLRLLQAGGDPASPTA
jgi:Uma2 family endonuclease